MIEFIFISRFSTIKGLTSHLQTGHNLEIKTETQLRLQR